MCCFWPATENVRRSSQVKIVHWLPDPMERLEDGKLIPTRPLGYMGRYKPNVCLCVVIVCVFVALLSHSVPLCVRAKRCGSPRQKLDADCPRRQAVYGESEESNVPRSRCGNPILPRQNWRVQSCFALQCFHVAVYCKCKTVMQCDAT